VRFFHLLNLNSNFEFGLVGNRPEPVRTGKTGSHVSGPVPTGSHVSGPVPTGSVNPAHLRVHEKQLAASECAALDVSFF
jgi:hypothetical protein